MSRVMSRVGRQLLLITLGGKFELAQRASSAAACVIELTVNVLGLAVKKEPRLEVESNVSIHQKTIQQEKL